MFCCPLMPKVHSEGPGPDAPGVTSELRCSTYSPVRLAVRSKLYSSNGVANCGQEKSRRPHQTHRSVKIIRCSLVSKTCEHARVCPSFLYTASNWTLGIILAPQGDTSNTYSNLCNAWQGNKAFEDIFDELPQSKQYQTNGIHTCPW